ncbi:hypothetical protein [Streptomyces sp. NPDC093109]|uniref:hypothetical protein n=1 Tax=Streptomyces sp. NPDC093109 TaxID=3154977 RepID=UPI00345010B1
MSEEMVPFSGSRSGLLASLPQVLPAALPHGALVAAIAELARTTLRVASAARYAVVQIRNESDVAIQLLDEKRRVMREDVIPVLAIAAAHQAGRQVLMSGGLDADLRADALADLDRKRQRRRNRL